MDETVCNTSCFTVVSSCHLPLALLLLLVRHSCRDAKIRDKTEAGEEIAAFGHSFPASRYRCKGTGCFRHTFLVIILIQLCQMLESNWAKLSAATFFL